MSHSAKCSYDGGRISRYFSRLANLAGAAALPTSNKKNARHFEQAYCDATEKLQDQVSRLRDHPAAIP